MSLDGLRFCYTNPLRWYGGEHVMLSQDYPERWSDFHPPPPNVRSPLASLHEWAYGQNEGEVTGLCLYGSSEVRADIGAERAFHAATHAVPVGRRGDADGVGGAVRARVAVRRNGGGRAAIRRLDPDSLLRLEQPRARPDERVAAFVRVTPVGRAADKTKAIPVRICPIPAPRGVYCGRANCERGRL